MKRLAVAVLLLAAATAGLVAASRPARPPSLQARVEQVTSGLRCPTCAGESVAVSRAGEADSMRGVVADQLRAGRTPDQVRSWFAERYGAWVLLEPPRSGVGLLVWVLPVAALAAGLALVLARTRRTGAGPARAPRPVARPVLLAAGAAGALGLAAAVVLTSGPTPGPAPVPARAAAAAPLSGAAPLTAARAMEEQGRYADAARSYRQALAASPDDAQLRLRLAFALLRAGDPAGARQAVAPLASAPQPAPQALLLLGLAQRAQHDPDADATLRRFLAAAPDDPSAGSVRALLGAGR